MSLPNISGHQDVRDLMGRAVVADTLPQSILLHGPRGVGKERLGLWIAQLLLCEKGGSAPCGECQGCRLTVRLDHPDLHWFFPLPRPSASSADKLAEKLDEARGDELQRWRDDPLHLPEFDKAPAHFVASIRNLQKLATFRPSIGNRKVFVVGDAELMVPQESSPEAANAFLKLLEEPPPATTIVLTSSQPGALLPTIRSRVLSVRVGLVAPSEIQALLVSAADLSESDALAIAGRARGSTRRAIGLARGQSADGKADHEAGKQMLLAAISKDAVARLAVANDQRPAGARATLVDRLEALSDWLRDLMAVSAQAEDRVSDPELLPILKRMAKEPGVTSESTIRALNRVDSARELAQRNVNPQLIIATMLAEIQRDFAIREG